MATRLHIPGTDKSAGFAYADWCLRRDVFYGKPDRFSSAPFTTPSRSPNALVYILLRYEYARGKAPARAAYSRHVSKNVDSPGRIFEASFCQEAGVKSTTVSSSAYDPAPARLCQIPLDKDSAERNLLVGWPDSGMNAMDCGDKFK